MSWRTRVIPGSFRGVPFVFDSAERTGGRRLAKHEYPKRDNPYPEDIGRKGRSFSMEIYIVGDSYLDGRDALIAALEEAGPGLLVHPYYGRLNVAVDDFRQKEDTREQGVARFSVSFVESTLPYYPSASVDTSAFLQLKAANGFLAIEADFLAGYTKPSNSIIEAVSLDAFGKAFAALAGLLVSVPGLSQANALAFQLGGLSSTLTAVIQQPGAIARAVTALIFSIEESIKLPLRALEAYRGLFAYGRDTEQLPEITPSRKVANHNELSVQKLIRHSALVAAASASSRAIFPAYDQAIEIRDELAAGMDEAAEEAGDETYQAFQDLRTALMQDISDRSAELPRLLSFAPPTTLPSLVIAHGLYYDANREAEVVARNNISHPGFVPGGAELRVLSNG